MLVDVVLVAAGSGTRMGGTDKSLINVAGAPLLRWSLDALQAHPSVRRVVLVTAAERVHAYGSLSWIPSKVTQIATGGDSRSASVLAGLTALHEGPGDRADVIAVHDAARPGLSRELLDRLFAACGSDASAPTLPLSDSIVKVQGEGTNRVRAGSLPRETAAAVQTPQCFAGQHLNRMISEIGTLLAGDSLPTDETSVLERIGVTVHLVDGDARLRKLTDSSDLPLMEALLSSGDSSVGGRLTEIANALGTRASLASLRVGFGDDVHPVGTSGESTIDLAPQDRRHLIPIETVEDSSCFGSVHQLVVDSTRVGEGVFDGGLGDFVEHHAVHGDLRLQILLEVGGNGLPLAVFVGGEIHGRRLLHELTQFLDDLGTALGEFVGGLEVIVDVDSKTLRRQIGHVSD